MSISSYKTFSYFLCDFWLYRLSFSLCYNYAISSFNYDTNYLVYEFSFIWVGVILVVSEERSVDTLSFKCFYIFCLFSFDYVFYADDIVPGFCLTLDDFTNYFSRDGVNVFLKSFISELLALWSLLLLGLLFWFYILTTSNSTLTPHPCSLHEHWETLWVCNPFYL